MPPSPPPLPQIQGRSFRRRGFTVLLRVSPPSPPSTSLSRILICPASSLPHTSDAPPKPHRPHLILGARAGNVEDAGGAMRSRLGKHDVGALFTTISWLALMRKKATRRSGPTTTMSSRRTS
ncbi:hypothetical protein C8J57DRAFT_1505330 [Mycena rebaudengoi]|nr:hypothetical protein C8J57DRAFT_1505330 [Mycena rebaudengoi]